MTVNPATPKGLDGYRVNQEVSAIVIPEFEIFFSSSGYGVYACKGENGGEFKIAGTFADKLLKGQKYDVKGKIRKYKGEKQILAEQTEIVQPEGEEEIIGYLQTLHGLKTKAFDIYEEFGEQSVDILINDPMAVADAINGVGKKSVEKWQKELMEQQETRHITQKLVGAYKLNAKQSKDLHKQFGDAIVKMIEENPYFLAEKVDGYGFKRCDAIAMNVGYDPMGEARVKEGLMHALKEAESSGHCYLPKQDLVKAAKELLDIKININQIDFMVKRSEDKDTVEYKLGGKWTYELPVEELKDLTIRYGFSGRSKPEQYSYTVVEMNKEFIKECIQFLSYDSRIILEEDRVYLSRLYWAEREVAKSVAEIANAAKPIYMDMTEELDKFLKEHNYELEKKQKEAVLTITGKHGGIYVLNGSAGSGKTFTLNIIIELLRRQYRALRSECMFEVMAPTGKAAKVASKSTGMDCKTIHRALGYNPQHGFEHDRDNPLLADCIVIDETSMLDILLAQSLFRAIKPETKVIFIGDTKQLPSVGAGNVLRDLIDSKITETVTLNVVKRQGKQSGIIKNANKIINSEMITHYDDAMLVTRDSPWAAHEKMQLAINYLQEVKEYALDDIQVLCPQRSSVIGTYQMNYLLQEKYNPNKKGSSVLNRQIDIKRSPSSKKETVRLEFRSGDKVIHIKNNYDAKWYKKGTFGGYIRDESQSLITNGECGRIVEIDNVREKGETIKRIIVQYENGYVYYDDNDIKQLDHAYALTIHKSQGSQWKAVLIPVFTQNWIMLNNNLFYTAYTRAEEYVCVIGQIKALYRAVKNHVVHERYTNLAEKLVSWRNS